MTAFLLMWKYLRFFAVYASRRTVLDEILSLIICKHNHDMLLRLVQCYQSVNVWTLSDKVQVTGVRPLVK